MSIQRYYTAREGRCMYGADILELMGANDEFPLASIEAVARVMQAYWFKEGYEKEIRQRADTNWSPTENYWIHQMSYIREILRGRKEFFEFYREAGGFNGEWKFVDKKDYQSILIREHSEIGTRTETHNEKIDSGIQKWKSIDVPHLEPVPLLTDSHGKMKTA